MIEVPRKHSKAAVVPDPCRRRILEGLAASAPLLAAAPAFAVPGESWKALAADVRTQTAWAWHHYAERCFGQDQIRPVSGTDVAFFFPDGPPLGLTIVDDIIRPMKQGDLCPGYWWSEQMKYYWLLFSDTDCFDYKTNYLSTEGNVLVGLK